jgi:membrane fusion protein (multidrug efflux system)
MVEQLLFSDRDTTLTPPAPAQRAPSKIPQGQLRPRSGNTFVHLTILVAAAIIVALFATQWDRWVGLAVRQVSDDAYVRGDITPLSAKVEGYVRRVAVDDFERVKEGDLLVEIEDDDYRARMAQAEADLLGAKAAIENLKARKAAQHAQVAEAEDAIKATQADVERTRLEAARQRTLLATTFGTRQRVEQADAAAERFAATLARNQAQLAKINLGYTRILAPVDGMVSERGVRDGQYVHAGSQVIAVVPLDNVWVVANYKETQLTHVAIGQRAEIRIDTFPGVVITATVDSIAPASGSQFSLLPPDNATGNFTKVVQRIPVKLRIGPDNPLAGKLRPGMSVIVTILTDTTPPPP